MTILILDNYDSFVFNLSRYLVEMGCDTDVVRNDAVTVADIVRRRPAALVISPGPCTPREAGVSVVAVAELVGQAPILGVCLGHQVIAAALGGRVVRAPEPVHGRTSAIHHRGRRLFDGLPNPLRATRYHSLIVEEASLPECLTVTARTADGLIMAVEHRQHPVFGIQFHPESVLTERGHQLLANFLREAGIAAATRPFDRDERERPTTRADGSGRMSPRPIHPILTQRTGRSILFYTGSGRKKPLVSLTSHPVPASTTTQGLGRPARFFSQGHAFV
ncbi:MAG: aminodeoxychorismate/anthranilate synthase component II [Planctomycetes bacterium]|nr:aminodeoxychorismate/anthranilate synthase component II [Planctomycetota bacterium]